VTSDHRVAGSSPAGFNLNINDLRKSRELNKKWFAISLPLLRSKKRYLTVPGRSGSACLVDCKVSLQLIATIIAACSFLGSADRGLGRFFPVSASQLCASYFFVSRTYGRQIGPRLFCHTDSARGDACSRPVRNFCFAVQNLTGRPC
jgi:hypothetical protein